MRRVLGFAMGSIRARAGHARRHKAQAVAVAIVVATGVTLVLAGVDGADPMLALVAVLLGWWLWRAGYHVWHPTRIAVIGDRGVAEPLGAELRAARLFQYEVVGWIGRTRDEGDPSCLGSVSELRSVVD